MLNETIGKLLSEQNKTQADLANFVGVRQNTVSDWLKKNKSPSSAYIYRISDFFGVSFNYLFTGKEDENYHNDLSEGERDILNLIHPLSPKEQQRVIGVVESYLNQRKKSTEPTIDLPNPLPSIDDGIRELKQEKLLEAFKNTAKPVK